MQKNRNRVAVVGGGAAGLFAGCILTGCAAAEVTVFEKNPLVGKKLLITGKGRCNLTNDCLPGEFCASVPVNGKFLYSAIHAFPPQLLIHWFEQRGVPLKTERGRRVFPVSDRSRDVVEALSACAGEKCRFLRESVLRIEQDGCFHVKTDKREHEFDYVILATGGVSYPLTGSTGDGYRFAAQLGHEIVPPSPSLVPLVCRESVCRKLMGLSLKNVRLTILDQRDGRTVFTDFGEMLFTHFGISGPMVLSASAHLRNINEAGEGRYSAVIDLKPALEEATLHARILRDFQENKNKFFSNALSALLPAKMIPVIVGLSGIPPEKKVSEVTREERIRLVSLLKNFTLTVLKTRPIEEAIITSGGVKTAQIDPKTMESKRTRNLYFAGEVIDVDAYTGGYNLQIAFSTAFCAAQSITGRIAGNAMGKGAAGIEKKDGQIHE